MRALPRIALKTLAISAVFVGIGLLIAQDQETLRIQSAYGARDPRFPDYTAAIMGNPLTRGDRYEMLVNGDRMFPPMLEAIETARGRISFETYIYSNGTIADRFTVALAAAARRGVQVTLVIDAVGSADLDSSHLDTMKGAGVRVGVFNRLTWHSLEEANYRTHRKILVVDGNVGFTGGAGVADHWLGDAQGPDHWRDTHYKVTGPAARLLEATFYENWIETGGVVKPEVDPEIAPAGTGSGRSVVASSSPAGGSNSMKRLYLLSIAAAERTIDISSPYFVTDESSRWAIEQAVKRGVKIRFLVEGDITDAKPVKFASRDAYESFLSLGVEIYEYQPTMMHAKSMVVDGIWSIIGSANFDNRSLELNDESNIATADAGLGAAITAQFERDLAKSKRLRLDEWRNRALWEKARERFWSFFGEVF
jgi:cardiolipin synthase